jgi:ADP-ribose pyrophosphatase YjhB (NUDIX family)
MSKSGYYQYCPYDGQLLLVDPNLNKGLPFCAKCDFIDYHNPRPCVAVLIVKQGQLLLARRAIEPAIGMWDIPGGFVKSSESAETAACREVLEETGLTITLTGFLGSLADVYKDERIPTLNLCFGAEVESGEMRPQSDVAELSWIVFDQIPEPLAFDHQQQVLERIRRRAWVVPGLTI